jgi:uncharacterized protein YraI
MLQRKLFIGAIAVLTLVLGAGAAMAAPGVAISKVNVRQGPGTSYKIIDTLHAGQRVDIQKCVSGWCYVGKPGTDGWVADSFLEHVALPGIIAPPPVVIRPPIVVRPPHHRPPHHRPRPPHHRPPVKPPHKPRPPVCTGKPQIQICRPK